MLYSSIVMLCVVAWSASGVRHGLWHNTRPDQYYNDDYNFDTGIDNFWHNFNKRMDNFDNDMDNIATGLRQQTRADVVGDQYWVSIEMPGFNTEDILVKSKKGLLVVEAVHQGDGQPLNQYQHISDLPDFVDEHGSWSYKYGILRVVYPLKRRAPTDVTI
ncbi:uncharacterized protein LOC116776262 [Danaus plexippus]|nr:uncharacterized protein LOC116776262 [Danaus plexippus]